MAPQPGGRGVVSFLDPAIPLHSKQIRPAWFEAIVTRIAWAANVATSPATLRAWAVAAGLTVVRIDSPSPVGQSLLVVAPAE